MDPKEKKVKEEELNVEETLNNAEEQPQDEQAENAVPMTHEEELEKELETAQETIEEYCKWCYADGEYMYVNAL